MLFIRTISFPLSFRTLGDILVSDKKKYKKIESKNVYYLYIYTRTMHFFTIMICHEVFSLLLRRRWTMSRPISSSST